MTKHFHRINSTSALKAGSLCVLASLLMPLAGCGGNNAQQTSSAPVAQGAGNPPPGVGSAAAQANKGPSLGLTTKQKAVILVGAAALYYYYQKKKKENAAKFPQAVQYYLSKNGRIYYRDPQTKQAIWVTPPPDQVQSVQVPEDQAQPYAQLKGYNNAQTGNGLDYYFRGPNGAEAAAQ